ncbi:tetratricopeptide repeat protein [Okeania sp. SIO2B3]|uniref:CHAT domain-containing protein n=1 Tax=Okeania sp. SIO2B3 TaxID=2607784 RepID=UPI0013BFDE8E|nr:tetratricopeptide repeat protein [Okeania sp. SIO2B3]NET44440.1 tetratricopeptide repeat protein [Okeania sp. SIO2B3]
MFKSSGRRVIKRLIKFFLICCLSLTFYLCYETVFPQILNADQPQNQLISQTPQQTEAEELYQQGQQFYNDGQYQAALETYQKALEIFQLLYRLSDNSTHSLSLKISETFHSIGATYQKLTDYPQAFENHQQALKIRREINDKQGIGSSLNSIGAIYLLQGNYDQALNYLQEALEIRQELGDLVRVGRTQNNIAAIYQNKAQYFPALEYYQQALQTFQELENFQGEAAVTNNIGLIYQELGQYEKSLEWYQNALEIYQANNNKNGEGNTINNIGLTYKLQKKYDQALEYYQQALTVREQINDKAGIGQSLNNIGLIYDEKGEYQKALEYLHQALTIFQEIGNKTEEGRILDSLGTVYKSLREYTRAEDYYRQALTIQRNVGDRASERITLSNIGDLLVAEKQPELAIILYKRSVNVTESIRQNLQNFPLDKRQSYAEKIADTYRRLADLLLQQNRVIEAQQVLDLLKVQELENYLNNIEDNEQTFVGIELLPQEQEILDNFTAIQDKAVQVNKELTDLQNISPTDRSKAQQQRITDLETEQKQIQVEFHNFISNENIVKIIEQLKQKTGGESIDITNLSKLQNILKIKQNAVLLYPLILDDRIELVLVKSTGLPIHRSIPINKTQLKNAIIDLRAALTYPRKITSNEVAQKAGQKLYKLLIEPLETDLFLAQTKTIIYAPDGLLRYIPIAALYDGKKWLIERFNINNITAASLTNFNSKPLGKLRVLAAAFSQGNYKFLVGSREFRFSGLKFAGQEVETLAKMIPNTTKLLNQAFNWNEIISRVNKYNILHFATHADFVNGQPEDSFILFGDGSRLTLRDITNLSLPNIDLAVLSACRTGVGGILKDGSEILGLGYQMQRAGVKTSLASLWQVDDLGTQVLMIKFYRALKTGNITKAEALRKAQLALINGSINEEEAKRLRHPYYWAPFILIGDGL